jgi:hypothetical protein
MEDRPKIRPQPELLQHADLEAIDSMVAELIAQERELSASTLMLTVTVATLTITVALIRDYSYAPEDVAGRALAVAELVLKGWSKDFGRRSH